MAMTTFEFEKPIADLEAALAQLHEREAKGEDVGSEIRALELEIQQTRERIYRNLTPHQRVLVARQFDRPHGGPTGCSTRCAGPSSGARGERENLRFADAPFSGRIARRDNDKEIDVPGRIE